LDDRGALWICPILEEIGLWNSIFGLLQPEPDGKRFVNGQWDSTPTSNYVIYTITAHTGYLEKLIGLPLLLT